MVESIDFVLDTSKIKEEWFGLILLPLVSFAADGAVGVVYFIRHMLRHFFTEPIPPATLARGEAIDLSIQFTLFWMPVFVLVGWWTNKPLTLLFGNVILPFLSYFNVEDYSCRFVRGGSLDWGLLYCKLCDRRL